MGAETVYGRLCIVRQAGPSPWRVFVFHEWSDGCRFNNRLRHRDAIIENPETGKISLECPFRDSFRFFTLKNEQAPKCLVVAEGGGGFMDCSATVSADCECGVFDRDADALKEWRAMCAKEDAKRNKKRSTWRGRAHERIFG